MKCEGSERPSSEVDEIEVKSDVTLPVVLLGPRETCERGEFEVDLEGTSDELVASEELLVSSGNLFVEYAGLCGRARR